MFNPFGNMMQQFQKMQEMFKENMKKIEQDLAAIKITGEAGAGMVKITINGNGDVLNVEIDDSVYQEDSKQVLQDLIAAAFNDVKVKRERMKAEKLNQIMKSLGLPADVNFPFL